VRYEVVAEGFDEPINVRANVGSPFEKGSEVRLHIDPGQVLIFPPCADKVV
jgi:hypothetical protein